MAPQSSKKRSAPTQSTSNAKSKRERLDKLELAENAKGKKRARPVTWTHRDESDASSEEEAEEEDEGYVESDYDESDPEVSAEKSISEPQQEARKFKSPETAREARRAQKAAHDLRRASKPHASLITEAKRIWRLAHKKSLPRKEREKLIRALMDVVRAHMAEIVFKHDASRIIQTIAKYGSAKERDETAIELKGMFKELAQNKYARFLVSKLIRFCPSHRLSILREFEGSVLKLLLHREASRVIADAYELYANAYERTILLREFYGKEASLVTLTAGSEQEMEQSKKGFEGVMEGIEGERRRRIMAAFKENILAIFNNSDKGAVSLRIVHRAVWEYLVAVNLLEDQEEREKLWREMFATCQEVLAEMVHTVDGSRVVREFIARGTAKDRKQIVKVLKAHTVAMCKDDDAQLVLFTALDFIDDTKLTAKAFVADLVAAAPSLYMSTQGRRSLIYLLNPRTRRHFTPTQIATLAETDPLRPLTSKKDDHVRAAEIRRAASPGLLSWVSQNAGEVARDPGGSIILGEILLYAEGDKRDASETLLKPLSTPVDGITPHLVSLSHTARLYKALLQGGQYSQKTHSIESAPLWSAVDFAKQFVNMMGPESTLAMIRVDGGFVIAALCEQLAGQECTERDLLRSWFTPEVRQEIEGATKVRGAGVLAEALEKLV